MIDKNLCFECRIAIGWKKKNSGFHTGVKSKCDKCGKTKVMLPGRHYVNARSKDLNCAT